MDTPEMIGERLKLLREAFGFTEAKAWCDHIGIATNAWNHFERGRRPITVKDALKVATKTGVTLDWIYRGLEETLPVRVQKALTDAANGILSDRLRS